MAKSAKKKQAKKNAERQRRLRQERESKGLCRTCGQPAAISKKTGRLAKECKRHLAKDLARKTMVPLTWSARPARATGKMLNGGIRLL